MGIFEKFKSGFKKSASAFTTGLRDIVVKKEIDDKTLDKIEDYLIQSDVGIVSASEIREIISQTKIDPNKDLTLTELFATQGINQTTAKTKAIYVLREDVTKFLHIDIYEIDLRNPGALIAANKFYILPNDIVFIPSTRLVEWNKVISLLTPSETLFSTYKPYIKEQDTWYIMNTERESD